MTNLSSELISLISIVSVQWAQRNAVAAWWHHPDWGEENQANSKHTHTRTSWHSYWKFFCSSKEKVLTCSSSDFLAFSCLIVLVILSLVSSRIENSVSNSSSKSDTTWLELTWVHDTAHQYSIPTCQFELTLSMGRKKPERPVLNFIYISLHCHFLRLTWTPASRWFSVSIKFWSSSFLLANVVIILCRASCMGGTKQNLKCTKYWSLQKEKIFLNIVLNQVYTFWLLLLFLIPHTLCFSSHRNDQHLMCFFKECIVNLSSKTCALQHMLKPLKYAIHYTK